MNIKDAYIHGTHGVVKNINVAIKESEPYDDSILYYTLADLNNTSRYVKLPLASATQNGLMSSLDKIKLNNLSTDAKHTAGSTNSDSKLFLIGATSQSANPQTYSHDTAYVGSDGFLYSNAKKVDMDLVVPLNAQGSRIPADADLNTIEYLKIGNYYCSSTANAATIKNCPVSGAFRMEVYSILEPTPSESSAWTNRLRKLTTLRGKQYIQYCKTEAIAGEFTYEDWIYIPTVKAVMDTDTNGSITNVGDSATPVYINTNGNFEACTNVQSDISKAVDASTRITTQEELDAFIEPSKVKFAILSKDADLAKPILGGKDGLIVSHGWSGNSNFGYQMAYDDNGYNISFRYCNNGTWSAWKALTFEGHTHNYAGSDSAGGPANEVKISPGSSNVERNIVVANGNSLFTVPKVTGNYAAGTLTANYFKFNECTIKHPEDNSNFWQAIFGETLPTGLTTVKPFRFDLSGGASPTTVSYNNNTVQLYNNHAASLIWTTYETFGYLNIPAYPREMDNVWIGGGNNNTEIGWSAKLFHSRKNLIPQEKDTYDVGSSEYKWKDVYATTFIGNLDGYYVNKLTGYTETKSDAKITAADTLNAALSKLEHKADLAYKWVSSVTSETDTDEYVNKWDEIVDFLDSVKEGSDITDEFVTRKTEQTITGLKTISSSLFCPLVIERSGSTNTVSLRFKNSYGILGSIGMNTVYGNLIVHNADTTQSKIILDTVNYSNYALPLSGGTMTGTIASQSIIPKTTNTYNLGSSDYIWRNVYATTFDGALRSKDIRELTGITSDFGDKTFTPFFSNVTMPTDNWWSGFTSKGWNNVYDSWQLVGFSGQGNTPIIDLHWRNGVDNVWNNWKRILDSSNYSNYALSLSGGAMIGAIDLTNSPNPEDEYKMGLRLLGSNSGGIHFKKLANAANDWGNAITWGYNDGDAASAGIYTKTSGSYGSKMYFATTNLFSDGPKAALEIDAQGNITALRNKFIGNLTGNATSSTKTGDGTNVLYVEKQNEINFGGTAVSSTIYFGYRETDSKVIPSKFVFGSKTGTAELVAKTFTGALQGNASSASMLVEIPIKTNAKYWVSTSSWTNTGYTFESLDAGTYAIQLTSDNLVASGIMSVLKNVVDTMGDEIPLHVYGTAGWRPYLRTRENKLQIASNDVSNTERTVTIKIARIL